MLTISLSVLKVFLELKCEHWGSHRYSNIKGWQKQTFTSAFRYVWMSLINCGLQGAPAARATRSLDLISPIFFILPKTSTYIVGVPVTIVQLEKKLSYSWNVKTITNDIFITHGKSSQIHIRQNLNGIQTPDKLNRVHEHSLSR